MSVDDRATLTALDAARTVFRTHIESNQGRVIDMAGDSVLAVFETATGAVMAALAVQLELNESGSAISEERRMRFRIGVHLGDVIEKPDGTVYGDGVNIAARLESLAEPGGVTISDAVRGAVKGKVSVDFEDQGEQAVKNIPYPVRAYQVRAPRGAPTSHKPGGAVKPASTGGEFDLSLPNKPSIAVLAFNNMSGDPEQEYFADGIVEDLISALSRIKWLFVIARNSSFIYKGKPIDVKQVGRALGVRYALEGSVRKAGSRVRISAQLIEAETGAHLWAEHYDRSLDDIFALQDDITMSVIGAIEPSLRNAEIERVRRTRPNSLDAYDLLLRALPFAYTAMPEDSAKAIPLLERALEIESGYAAAHASLAWCLHQRFSRAGLREEDRVRAINHARAAIMHGGDDATALAIAGFVISLDDHDNATALTVFDQALALSSSNVFALRCSAIPLAWMGITDLAIERAQRALRLSPYDSLGYLAYIALSVSHFHLERYELAARAAHGAIASNPRFTVPYALLAAALVRLGQGDKARAVVGQVLALDRTFTIAGFAVTVGLSSEVYSRFASAWREAGLPD